MPHYWCIYIYKDKRTVERLFFTSEKRYKKEYDRLKKENIFFSVVTLPTKEEKEQENIQLIEDRSGKQ